MKKGGEGERGRGEKERGGGREEGRREKERGGGRKEEEGEGEERNKGKNSIRVHGDDGISV